MIIIGARPAVGKALALDPVLPTPTGWTTMGQVRVGDDLVGADGKPIRVVAATEVMYGRPCYEVEFSDGEVIVDDDDWTRLARRMSEVSEAPLFIDDSPNMSMMEIRAKCRRLKQQHDLRLVVIDYLQLMTSGKRVESRQVEVSEFSRSLKLLAKELGVPVIALSQLNRGPEQRTDKKPMVSDLRESGSIEQDADMVILLHREDAYEKESPRAGEADLIVAKHRNGPTATITVAFQGHYSRFVDMAQ